MSVGDWLSSRGERLLCEKKGARKTDALNVTLAAEKNGRD